MRSDGQVRRPLRTVKGPDQVQQRAECVSCDIAFLHFDRKSACTPQIPECTTSEFSAFPNKLAPSALLKISRPPLGCRPVREHGRGLEPQFRE